VIDLENPIGFRHPIMLVAVTALAKKKTVHLLADRDTRRYGKINKSEAEYIITYAAFSHP
jgi:hypothetical protein